jgi:nitrogen fixation protein FixH
VAVEAEDDARGRVQERAGRRHEPWPLAVLAALLSMIAGCLALYVLAAAHVDALVIEDAYGAGLEVNENVRADRRAEALGMDLALEGQHDDGALRVRVELRHAAGGLAEASRVVVRRERPAEGGLDADFELAARGEGFEGDIPLPRPGRWRLRVTAAVEGETLRRVFLLDAPRGPS